MGNGQRRNRRGARPRTTPHKHGGAGNPGRATQLIPPVSVINEARSDAPNGSASDETDELDELDTADESGVLDETTSVPDIARVAYPVPPPSAGTLPGAGTLGHNHPPEREPAPARRNDDGAHLNAPHNNTAHTIDHANHTIHANHTSHQHRMNQPDAPEQEALPPKNGHTDASQPGAPPARNRFGAFYAPGQGPRGERGERVAPPIVAPVAQPLAHTPHPPQPVAPHVSPASLTPRRLDRPERMAERVERVERVGRAPIPSGALDEDDGSEYTGPRGDVRGAVGTLVDSLHEVFVRDRAIASQGGVARCGVCYLHFPVGELTYREGEGFYVCASCAHALGSARVPMVRRQQRQ